MKKLGILIFAIIFVFSAGVFAGQNPMLENVRQVLVTIDHAGLEPNEPPVNWTAIQQEIAGKLTKSGISVVYPAAGQGSDIPELRITARMLFVSDAEQFVFHIETSLYRFVELPDKTDLRISSPVWTGTVTMQSAAAENINDAVTKTAMRQVEMFIRAWKAEQVKKNDSGRVSQREQPQSLPLHALPGAEPNDRHKSETQSAQAGYSASKNGKIFHKADCAAVKTISSENMVMFASRQEAIDSGRRPCKKCNP